jgi:hypothetical protein
VKSDCIEGSHREVSISTHGHLSLAHISSLEVYSTAISIVSAKLRASFTNGSKIPVGSKLSSQKATISSGVTKYMARMGMHTTTIMNKETNDQKP